MKQSLKVLFKEYGSVLGVTAHRNLRMRGQAFVTLDTKEAAAKAVKEVQKFPLYGKPLVSHSHKLYRRRREQFR
jgi:RNA recognition motif-containing protein